MPNLRIEFEGRPLLDLTSYARKGPGRRDRLSSDIELISRTVHRVPEVMVKILTRGGQDLGAVRRHLDYLNRGGKLEIEADDGQQLAGKGVDRTLLEDWDLDLEEHRRKAVLDARPGWKPPKLVHKVLFSMPPGTPPEKVLKAVKNFAREEFALKHRYAMVLHTDEPHPHVHMVIKAVSEQGERLHIRKATLRGWRQEFARHLRALGVPANATERAVRGENRSPKRDEIYRAESRGESWHVWQRLDEVGRRPVNDGPGIEPGRETLIKTRREVVRGWREASAILVAQGQRELAAEIIRFLGRMPSARTDQEIISETLNKRPRDGRARGEFTR